METFVIRVWLPATSAPEAGTGLIRLHGVVEHVASGRSGAFRGLDELEALVLSAVRRDRHDERATEPPVPTRRG
jgi:hypothetical protein